MFLETHPQPPTGLHRIPHNTVLQQDASFIWICQNLQGFSPSPSPSPLYQCAIQVRQTTVRMERWWTGYNSRTLPVKQFWFVEVVAIV